MCVKQVFTHNKYRGSQQIDTFNKWLGSKTRKKGIERYAKSNKLLCPFGAICDSIKINNTELIVEKEEK